MQTFNEKCNETELTATEKVMILYDSFVAVRA